MANHGRDNFSPDHHAIMVSDAAGGFFYQVALSLQAGGSYSPQILMQAWLDKNTAILQLPRCLSQNCTETRQCLLLLVL